MVTHLLPVAMSQARVAQDVDDGKIGHELLDLVQSCVGEFDRREHVFLFLMIGTSTHLHQEAKLTPCLCIHSLRGDFIHLREMFDQ